MALEFSAPGASGTTPLPFGPDFECRMTFHAKDDTSKGMKIYHTITKCKGAKQKSFSLPKAKSRTNVQDYA